MVDRRVIDEVMLLVDDAMGGRRNRFLSLVGRTKKNSVERLA